MRPPALRATRFLRWSSLRRANNRLHRGVLAPAKDLLECGCLTPVDGEPVREPDVEHLVREPAPILPGDPLRCILARLLTAVHVGCGQGEVSKVAREPRPGFPVSGAEPRVMRLTRGDNVLDVGLGLRGEAGPGVGPVHRAQRAYDFLFHRLRVAVVPFLVVGRASMFRGHGEQRQVSPCATPAGVSVTTAPMHYGFRIVQPHPACRLNFGIALARARGHGSPLP